ncbi:MAG: MarR family transcriptional regulator [Roseobacter sp.]|nr:MarR family transcriptional regulator [Roseobacter sp.]
MSKTAQNRVAKAADQHENPARTDFEDAAARATVGETRQPGEFVLEDFLPYRLSLLSNTVSEGIATDYRAHHDLSVTEWRVLAILGRFPGLTASHVMERGAMDKVAVSRAVNKLEEKGMLSRTTNPQDRRRVALKLSRKGVNLFNAVIPGAMDYERRLLESLSLEERATLNRLLKRLQDQAHGLNGAKRGS